LVYANSLARAIAGGPATSAELAPAPVNGDEALLGRLIANLLDNAAEHNIPGGTITIRTGVEQGAAVLVVENTGPVIAPELVEPLFEPFRRLAGDRTGSGGHYGLGLSIVRAIATAHAATATAVTRPDGGLTVTVRFPSVA
jgi:signal transduction histidine kinase